MRCYLYLHVANAYTLDALTCDLHILKRSFPLLSLDKYAKIAYADLQHNIVRDSPSEAQKRLFGA
jgi:hypothetical protein